MLTYFLLFEPVRSEKVQTTRTVSYGRSCQRCKLYFVTTDASAYTCQWCAKHISGEAAEIADPWGEFSSSTHTTVQEEV
jgi:hypothetical protein